MEMQQLRHFIAVAQHGSIGAAAEALNLSQPGLSRSIRALEDALGTALFERRARGVELTEYGRTLLVRAQVIRNEHDRALAEAQALRSLRSGDVRLGLQSVVTRLGGRDVLTAFMDENPGVRLSVITASGLELAEQVARADLDLAFTLFPASYRSAEVIEEELFSLRCGIYQRRDAARSIAEAQALPDLADRAWALTGALNFREALNDAFAGAGSQPPRRFVQCSSLNLLLDLALARDFVTVLPESVATAPEMAGRWESCDVAAPGGYPRGGLLYRRGALQISSVDWMAALFRAFGRRLAEA